MDNLTKEQRRKNMQNIRSENTKPERLISAELRKKKICFSQHSKSVTGKPDFVFRKKKIAVFIDSDFWHGHKTRFIMPKSNLSYWQQKIQRNKQRDKEVNTALKKKGWRVLRFWEYDFQKNLKKVITRIMKVLDCN